MSIKTKILSIVLGLALVAVIVPAAASAAALTSAQVSAIVSLLQSFGADANTVANVTASLTGTAPVVTTTPSATTGTGACAGITFNTNFTVGAKGPFVKCLQSILNQSAATRVATTGAGSPGNETTTFGPATLKAVNKYQVANGLAAAPQVGPKTRALLNAALGTVVVLPSPGQQTGSVSAMLASSTPASGAVVAGQATADLLHVVFSGSGTVTSVTLQRSGISDQNTLSNVYLYDGAVRLTDGNSFNTNGQITFNGFSIAVNGSHEISVKADLPSTAANNASTIAVAVTGFTANGTAVTANVMGNTQMIVVGNLATAYLGANSVVSTSVSPTTLNAGTSQYTVWSAPIQINTRSVTLKMGNFKMIGSAPTNALANIKLFVDGVDSGKTGSVITINGSGYVSFDFTSAPLPLATGSHTIDVRADVVGGASRTMQLSLQQASDLTVTDPQVGVNIALLGPAGASFTANLGAYLSINVGSGSVLVDPTFSTSTNVPAGATNTVIGRFAIQGYGEDVKVNSINVTPTLTPQSTTCTLAASTAAQNVTCTSTTGFVAGNSITSAGNGAVGTVNSITSPTVMNVTFATNPTAAAQVTSVTDKGLNNVTLYFNGSQIGSSQSPTATGSALAFNLGSQMIVPAGTTSTLEVRADLQGSNSIAYGGGTVSVSLPAETTSNAQGQSSQNTLNLPSGLVTGNTLTIQSASLSVSQNTAYANQSVTPNSPAAVKIGSFSVMNQSTSESVRLTTLTVALTSDGSTALNTSTGTDYRGLTNLKTSDTTGSGSSPISPTASNTFSVNDVLAPGASMNIDILANTGSATTLTQVITKLTVASIGVTSNISSAGTAVQGQTISLSSGYFAAAPTVDTSKTTAAQYIASSVPNGAANAFQAQYRFVTTSGPATIQEVKFTVKDSTTSTYGSVGNPAICLAGTTTCAPNNGGVVDLTGLNLSVPTGGGLSQAFTVSFAGVGTNGIAPSTTSDVVLTYVKYVSGTTTTTLTTGGTSCTNAGGTQACLGTNGVTAVGAYSATGANGVSLVGSMPTVVVPATSVAGLTINQSTKIGQVTITASPSGPIEIGKITFAVGQSGFSAVSGAQMVLTAASLKANGTVTGTCVPNGATTTGVATTSVTCTLGSSYATDYPISAGSSQQFDLYGTVWSSSSITANSGVGTISTSVTQDTSASSGTSANGVFIWDDDSMNGTNAALAGNASVYGYAGNGTGLNSFLINTNNFSNNVYQVHN